MTETAEPTLTGITRARLEQAFELWGRDIAANPGAFLDHDQADALSVEERARRDADALLRYLQQVEAPANGGDKIAALATQRGA